MVILLLIGILITGTILAIQYDEKRKRNREEIWFLREQEQLQKQEKHKLFLTDKYGMEIAERIINNEYWIGMTTEQLIDGKGRPSRIEEEILKTKTKTTYIYGNKNSGDYFVVENGVVVKIVDR